MIVLLDTSHKLDVCAAELGCVVEQFFTPLNGFNRQKPAERFAIDNGAFSRFNRVAFEKRLAKHRHERALCRFVAVPDVVGSARRTLEVFDYWHDNLSGWPLALVAQDGQEDLPIPWHLIDALFIGGSSEWKDGPHAAACLKAAKALGKWVHVGRVNSVKRFLHFEALGADSCDGTGLARYSHMREKIRDRKKITKIEDRQPSLFGSFKDDYEEGAEPAESTAA